MTTDDLIAKLMELDPEGNKRVYISGMDYEIIPAGEIRLVDGDIIIDYL